MRKKLGTALVVMTLALGGAAAIVTPAGAADAHQIAVTPSTGLVDGQTVTVSGTGFVETPVVNDWSVALCDAAILSEPITLTNALNDCDATSTPFVFVHADEAGNLTTPYVVRKSFTTSGGVAVDCSQPEHCAILVAQITDADFVGAAAPISFGPPATVGGCFRSFVHDHGRGRLVRLLTCVFAVLHPHRSL